MKKRILSLFLIVAVIATLLPGRNFDSHAADNEFTAVQATGGKNYVTLSWEGVSGGKYAIAKSDGKNDIYETIPLKYSIRVLNVYPGTGDNLKGWMETNSMGSPYVNGTQYNMTVDKVSIDIFNGNPEAYLGVPGFWNYDVIYFGGFDGNNNYDISISAKNRLEQFIKSGGGVLLGHDTASLNHSNFKYLASTYLNLQATEDTVVSSSPDYIPTFGNTLVKVARKGILTNYPYVLGDVDTVMMVPESHSYHEFASSNVWFSFNGTNGNWDPGYPEMTTYKGKTGTNNFYLTTLNNMAMIQTGHSNGNATTDEQRILTNTLYYLAQTTTQQTFDDHSAQDLTAPSKVSGSVTVLGNSISFTDSVDIGNEYSYKLYTVDDLNGIKIDTGKTAQATVKTGLKGYSYTINQNSNKVGVDSETEVTSANIDISSLGVGNYYLHICAVDNARNASEESILPFTISAKPTGLVALNKPIYNNDKSGYSFKSACITNFRSVNSIILTTTNGTTVQSVPAFLTPVSKQESTGGDTHTYTYSFEKGLTIAQAEEFLRGVVLNYVAGTKVSTTLVNNSTGETAVGTYNLATDGGVEEVATVTLNSPVYGSNNKSEFSFNNAVVKNITTIYSITIKLDNYTNVISKPTIPTTTNEMTNIAGATNTITYQFKSGITLSEAQSFLRGLTFHYGGLKASSTTNVSITLDGNETNLPNDANITEFNGHYYMYVPSDFIYWTDAYNRAKSFRYMGLRGYLATITSKEEDEILTNISSISAWSAGTRYINNDSSKLLDPASVTSLSEAGYCYYWACGPEAGNIYYNSIVPTTTPGAGYTGYNGAYNNWGADPGQPDAYAGIEACMQVNWQYDNGANGIMHWNDLPNEGLPNVDLVKGYFVEFSDYNDGRGDSYKQSANGKSIVPITVEKGEIFTSVKDGSTYYVDAVLQAFDRNITNITVNGNAFNNGDKLAGDLNTTYAIEATDLDGNKATMTINMKSIDSISSKISSLTINNVTMADVPNIKEAKDILQKIDTTDASVAQKNKINSAIENCNNLYFALFNATATTPNGTNGWYKNGLSEIRLTAPDGFYISSDLTGIWTTYIILDQIDGAAKTATYYLKENSTGDISNVKTFSYKVDKVAPTGTINIKTNQFKTFLNRITAGLFYKDSVEVSISGNDLLTSAVSISYQKVSNTDYYNENGTWTTGSTFTVNANEKFLVYAELMDAAGNKSIINSNGVIVYTDSTSNTEAIEFTKKGTVDITAKVNLNGNTIKDIKNGDITLTRDTDYTVANDTITFKASYLDSLAVNNYIFTISYNPMGEDFVGNSDSEVPATTELSLTIKAKDMSEKAGETGVDVTISPESMIYSGDVFRPTVTVKDQENTLLKDTDYLLSWSSDMTSAGKKTLTITFIGDYTGMITREASIENAELVDLTPTTQSVTYNGNEQLIVQPVGRAVNNQPVSILYSADGLVYNLTSAPEYTSAGVYNIYYQLSAPNHKVVRNNIVFTIKSATDNTISNLVLDGWTFGNRANTPTATAKFGTIVYTYSDREDGTYTTAVPTSTGTYYVKASVTATNDYNGCEAINSFVISKREGSKEVILSGVKDYYLYTGSALTPEPIVTLNNIVLTKGIDYTVAYENNTEIGTAAKVIVTLMGDYSGKSDKSFEIRYGSIEESDLKNVLILPEFNSMGWYNKDIVIAAVGEWKLCSTPNGLFSSTLTISQESDAAGTNYLFYIKAADGSVYERTVKYKLDKVTPNATITIQKSGHTKSASAFTNNLFFNSDVDVTVTGNDALSGISRIEVYKADRELTEKELVGVKWSQYSTSIHEKAVDAKQFIYYARLTDCAGNQFIVKSDCITFDTTAPVITGITNNGIYYTTQKVMVNDTGLNIATINNIRFVGGRTLSGNVNGTYTIFASDKAGNSITVTITMKPIEAISIPLDKIPENGIKPEDRNRIEEIKRKAEAVDITNATPEEKKNLQDIIERCDSLLEKLQGSQNDHEKPDTSDNSNIQFYMAMLVFSGGILCFIIIFKKRKRVEGK